MLVTPVTPATPAILDEPTTVVGVIKLAVRVIAVFVNIFAPILFAIPFKSVGWRTVLLPTPAREHRGKLPPITVGTFPGVYMSK
jgi:hypothetical protein